MRTGPGRRCDGGTQKRYRRFLRPLKVQEPLWTRSGRRHCCLRPRSRVGYATCRPLSELLDQHDLRERAARVELRLVDACAGNEVGGRARRTLLAGLVVRAGALRVRTAGVSALAAMRLGRT